MYSESQVIVIYHSDKCKFICFLMALFHHKMAYIIQAGQNKHHKQQLVEQDAFSQSFLYKIDTISLSSFFSIQFSFEDIIIFFAFLSISLFSIFFYIEYI